MHQTHWYTGFLKNPLKKNRKRQIQTSNGGAGDLNDKMTDMLSLTLLPLILCCCTAISALNRPQPIQIRFRSVSLVLKDNDDVWKDVE